MPAFPDMTETVIQAQNVAKCYYLGTSKGSGPSHLTFRETIMSSLRAPLARARGKSNGAKSGAVVSEQEFWALQDVSFEIKRGEVVGVIGRNGAGKSTLLKVLSRITEPTKGRVTIRGRVASLLEVGTGFHPELTGRENVFLNGAILGMSRQEIKAKFDEIVAFAEVERFLDTPVKRYSSGMYVRLAFAVAAHLEPEILIVDEVLAVGDSEFQKKCLGKMDDVAKRQGRTVLFVSHNMGAVNQLCSRVILLQGGHLICDDVTSVSVKRYLNSASGVGGLGARRVPDASSGKKAMLITGATARAASGEPKQTFGIDEGITIDIAYEWREAVRFAEIGFAVRDERGRRIFISETPVPTTARPAPTENIIRTRIPASLLVPGRYFFTFHVHLPSVLAVDFAEDLLVLDLIDTGSWCSRYGELDYGCVFVNCDWEADPAVTVA